MLSTRRSQARQPVPVDAEEDGQQSGRFDALHRMISRREGSSETLAGTGTEGFEVWLGLGSRHSHPVPSFMDRVQSFFGRRRGGISDRLGFRFGSHHSPGSRRLVDMRDFLLGPGGDLLIQQLIEGGQVGRNGSSPASKAAVEAMPTLIISKPGLDADDFYCAVCKEVFDIGGEAREMPCKHIYHTDCILPWLALHNSCPICRHEMPSEVLVDNQARRSGEGPENIQGEGNTGTNGERGLAIVGIPGIGILVRSFLLFGTGAHNEANVENEASNAIMVTEMSNAFADVNSRQSEDVAGTMASCINEIHSSGIEAGVRGLQHSRSINVGDSHTHGTILNDRSSIESGSEGEVITSRRGRNFLSWLSRPTGSQQMRSANMANRGASGSSSRRRRRLWF